MFLSVNCRGCSVAAGSTRNFSDRLLIMAVPLLVDAGLRWLFHRTELMFESMSSDLYIWGMARQLDCDLARTNTLRTCCIASPSEPSTWKPSPIPVDVLREGTEVRNQWVSYIGQPEEATTLP